MGTTCNFNPGDIIEQAGECYQILENHGNGGIVRNFPSEETTGFEMAWEVDGTIARRMGQASLPAPSPCSTGGSCPTYEIKPKAVDDGNIIARQS
ncbi:hypothetical protein [Motiliproteus sp. MSK22-1]|uniref:hypothetical protein n=1 Tax=Motiliproteus sp. MSK22-1 TaxID=1897630 RepID=UPI00097821DA|nr:hypothetical protein [Motiliproteus sp. MSK22-1]OMH29063.1 hypothetical protein BGP75_20110 [Motiliproteus sp. MSK22-1]